MRKITQKSFISFIIALIMILNLVPFGVLSQVHATDTIANVNIASDGTITWDAVEGDVLYDFGIVEPNVYSGEMTETNGDLNYYMNLNSTSAGVYTARVSAWKDEGNTLVARTDVKFYYDETNYYIGKESVEVKTVEDFKEAVKNPLIEKIILGEDIELTKDNTTTYFDMNIADNQRILDINGHILSYAKDVYYFNIKFNSDNGKLLIIDSVGNGRIKYNERFAEVYDSSENNTIIFDKIVFECTNGDGRYLFYKQGTSKTRHLIVDVTIYNRKNAPLGSGFDTKVLNLSVYGKDQKGYVGFYNDSNEKHLSDIIDAGSDIYLNGELLEGDRSETWARDLYFSEGEGNSIVIKQVKFTVSFDLCREDVTAPESIEVVRGGIFPPPEVDSIQCYDFAGWYKDKELTQVYEFETDVITNNITLYAKWNVHHNNIMPIPAKSATCKETGNNTYYKCNDCGKVYKDAEGIQETTVEAETIEKLAHTPTDITTTKVTNATLTKEGQINKIIQSKCSICGEVVGEREETVTIPYPKTISLSKISFTYNKKVQKPNVKVVGSDGKEIASSNYSVKYLSKNSKKIGEYKVTITFKGSYEGTKTLTYKIVPKGTSISKLTADKKQFKATWKVQKTETTGYQVQYSTNKNFKTGNKTVKITKNKTNSSTVKKLKAKKKYYVRIRTYKTVNGKKIYSDWSKAKNVKTKK